MIPTIEQLVDLIGHRDWKGVSAGDLLILMFLPGAEVPDISTFVARYEAKVPGWTVEVKRDDLEHALIRFRVEFKRKGVTHAAP